MIEPTTGTAADSQTVKPSPTPARSSVPAARTRSPTPRLDQRTKTSNVRRIRRESGTGSTPHSGGLRRRSIGSPKPPDIYRTMESKEERGSESLRGLPEFLVRVLQRGDEGQLLPREEIDERSPAGAHVVDPILEAELLNRRDGMAAADA